MMQDVYFRALNTSCNAYLLLWSGKEGEYMLMSHKKKPWQMIQNTNLFSPKQMILL